MNRQQTLAGVKARWPGDELHHPSYWAGLASRDIPYLLDLLDAADEAITAGDGRRRQQARDRYQELKEGRSVGGRGDTHR